MDARRVRRAVAAAVVAAAASAAVVLSVAAGTAAAGGSPSVSLPATPLLGVVRAAGAAAGSTPAALRSFGSCRWLGDYFRTEASSRQMLCNLWGCYRRGVRARPNTNEGGAGATSTNVQVEGVDEPDIVKGNGSVQYVVSKSQFYVLAVRGRGAKAVRVGSVKVGQAKALLADGSAMLVIGTPSRVNDGPDAGWTVTRLTRVDVSTLEAPVITSTVDVQGRIVASRSIGGTARLVIKTNFLPALTEKVRPLANLSAVREFVAAMPDEAWVPTYTLRRFPAGGGEPTVTTAPLASCARTYRPRVFEGWTITTVLALPVGEMAWAGDFGSAAEMPGGVAVVSGAGIIYASRKAVYVTSEGRIGSTFNPKTDVHAFSIEGSSAVYVASTTLVGRLLNQWAFYQRRDVLFVATTLSPRSRTASSSTLSALKVQGRTFVTVGTVPRIGVGEAITAVRYMGDLAFVVTFREVDPLYAIDLRDPSRMVTLGALKVPGFSRYLHPLAPGLLLGLGVSVESRRLAKASLFRVPSAATVDDGSRLGELATWTPPPIPGRPRAYSSAWQVGNDHRAFLYLPARRLIIAPMDVYNRMGRRTEATLLRVKPDGTGFSLVARITHKVANSRSGRITRAVVIDGRYLWTIAPDGVEVRDLDTLLVTSRAEL